MMLCFTNYIGRMVFGMKEAYVSFWRNYVNFRGKSTRSEYWVPTLVHTFLLLLAMVLMYTTKNSEAPFAILLMVIVVLFGIASFLPSMAVTARRLHDVGRSAKMLIIYYVLSFIAGAFENMNSFVGIVFNALFAIVAIYILVLTILPSRHVSPDNYTLI